MPPFEFLQREQLIFMLGIGVALTLVLLLARASRLCGWSLGRRGAATAERHTFADGIEEENRPVPWLIWLACGAYIVWAVAYVLYNMNSSI